MTPFPRGSYNPGSDQRPGAPAASFTKGNPDIRHATRRLLPLALWISCALATDPAGAAGPPYRATTQNGRGVTFEITPASARFDSVNVSTGAYVRVTVPGGYVAETPGSPALPVLSIPVGVPDGMSLKAKVVSAEWTESARMAPPLPVVHQTFVGEDPKTKAPISDARYEPDAAIYGRSEVWPREAMRVGEGVPLGDAWMEPAIVRLVRYDPAHKKFFTLRRMTLRVEFVPATSAQLKLRPAVRPGAEARVWQNVQRSTLGNYESARSFPRRATLPPVRPRFAPRRAAANPEFKIPVTVSGWSSVSFATMAAAGFPAGIAINQVGVWERGWDDAGDSATSTPIPVVARDANTNGLFDAGDAISFYARNLRDRVGTLSIENRYAYNNVYWLTWTGALAAVPDSISGVIADPAPALPTSFLDTMHLEQNQTAFPWPPPVGSPQENVEYMFWTDGAAPDQFTTPIPFVHPDVSTPFRIQARYQGAESNTHRMDIYYQSSLGTTDTLAFHHDFLGREIYLLDTGFTIPGSLIGPGTNSYVHNGFVRFSSSSTFQPGSISFLDWVDVTYGRLYVADANLLHFTSGSGTGITELHVGGFTQPAIEVYDITVPTAPLRVTGTTVTPTGPGAYQVSFRTDATAGARRFVALVAGAGAALAQVLQDAPSNLKVPGLFATGSFARSILITPEAFRTQADRLATFRRSQGYVVEVANVQDVYDEFNGGIKSATALRRYFQLAYDTWTPRPSFACLLGDASYDYRHDLPTMSSADWVPTYMAFETIASTTTGAELVANDNRLVLNLGNGGTEAARHTPSIFLGRIPASSAAELDAFVTKLIQYENFQPTDTWRGRQLLVSDDEYSSTIYFNAGYCLQPFESLFQRASENMAATADSSASGSDITSVLWNLADFTNQLATQCADPNNPSCRSILCVLNALRAPGGVVDSFFTEYNKGNLIVNVESHANRQLLMHEQIYFPQGWGDLDRIANFGRPNFTMVWGCHVNQFPDAPAGSAYIDSTDAIGEQWLLLPNAGSIGVLASTAFEIIDTNAAMNQFMAEAFYVGHSNPPAPGTPPGLPNRSRWILGEVVGQGYVRNALTGSFLQQAMNYTVTLFGDPMTHMDALPPRIFQVTQAGVPVADHAPIAIDTPGATDSLTIVARVRDEAGLARTDLVERSLANGAITPVDSTLYSVAVSDTGRAHTLTVSYRPRIDNYDLLVRSIDVNGRTQTFTLEVRSTARYLANGTVIVNGAFVESNASLRAEVTTPIPVTADSLTLLLDGVPLANVTKTALDATNRRWALDAPAMDLTQGTHTLDVEIGGRAGVFAQGSFNVQTSLALRRVAVVSPRLMGTGCEGSVFQFELSTPSPKVQLLLMTVSGRRVASLEWAGNAGFNVQCWDGRDSQGNVTAAGVYFYRLTAIDATGHKASQDGRMIRAR